MTVVANVVIPSIAGHLSVMLFLLIPIVLIEGLILANRHGLKFATAQILSLKANLWSTLAGLPLGYVCAIVGLIPAGIFVGFLPEWKIRSVFGVIFTNALGYGGTSPTNLDELGFYLGTLLMLIPYYLVTLRLERNYIAKLRPDLERTR